HQGYVGAVEGGDDGQRLGGDDLPRQHGGDSVGDGVVDVQHVEAVVARHLDHLGGERQRIGRVLEERVTRHDHLVEVELRGDEGEPRGEGVADDVDLVAALGQGHGELGRHDAGAAV